MLPRRPKARVSAPGGLILRFETDDDRFATIDFARTEKSRPRWPAIMVSHAGWAGQASDIIYMRKSSGSLEENGLFGTVCD